MRPYFEKMKEFGQELKAGQIKSTEANVGKLQEVEAQVDEAVQKVKNAGMPDTLRIWPVGSTLILEGYKGDASRAVDAKPLEIEVITKLAPAPIFATETFFPVDWSYARYTPDGTWSLSGEKLIECHQCHSIAFQLTGDLVFTPFR